MKDTPLGRPVAYPEHYAPETLVAVARRNSRAVLGIGTPLPFAGIDLWNAWELTWLEPGGKPAVAVARIGVPATSPNLIESKSLKLYLNSLAMTEFESLEAVRSTIAGDLAAVAGSPVDVAVAGVDEPGRSIASLPGSSLDGLQAKFDTSRVDPSALRTTGEETVEESLHTHLLRSLCPVTGQPDIGSLLVRYRGRRIDPAGLLRYVVSFRQHSDFHEACVERMFVDIQRSCETEWLTVYARYTRRGGIDINPFRSDGGESADNLRLWRQ